MIRIVDKRQCCGCAACVQKCPKHCISFYEDEEGFLYPRIDTNNCIDCGSVSYTHLTLPTTSRV